MQRTELIDKNELFELLEYILSDSKNGLYESYSAIETEIIKLETFPELKEYLGDRMTEGKTQFGFGVYNPEFKGKLLISKINLNPKYNNGKTYRYRIEGWGIIFIHLEFKNGDDHVECRVSVNTKKRAENWATTNPEFGNPEEWDWKSVENAAGKIVYRLKKLNS